MSKGFQNLTKREFFFNTKINVNHHYDSLNLVEDWHMNRVDAVLTMEQGHLFEKYRYLMQMTSNRTRLMIRSMLRGRKRRG